MLYHIPPSRASIELHRIEYSISHLAAIERLFCYPFFLSSIMPRKTNKSEYAFLRVKVDPATPHESLVLKELENCLNQCFGTTRARTNVDVLWCGEGGGEYVLRVANE